MKDKDRIAQLERIVAELEEKVRELEARPVAYAYWSVIPPTTYPYTQPLGWPWYTSGGTGDPLPPLPTITCSSAN